MVKRLEQLLFLKPINMKICVVGMGNMGQAIFELLGKSKVFTVSGCRKEDNPNEKLLEAEAFIIAVKPQSFADLASFIDIDLSEKVAISIMAGVSIENIQNKLNMKKVVRTLPNLPLKIGQSFTPWKASSELSMVEKKVMQKIFKSFGEETEVESEEQIELIGAISGCGPAYFAFLCEIMESYALEHGLNPQQARKIASSTFIGSANLLKKSGWSPEELRAKITSKGGVTNAAITHLQDNGFDMIFKGALDSAIKRTKELNQPANEA